MLKPSIIIPVWNDRDGLKRLLEQIIDYGISSEVIICDDASEESHSPESLGVTNLKGLTLKYIKSKVQRGAGAMRNIGLRSASGRHVLYFDSDDLLAPGLVEILDELEGKHFDFCIFRHHDSRVLGRRGTFENEEKLWERANAKQDITRLNSKDIAELVSIAAYPWNKIYRKHFLTSQNIKCTEIPVHNDIELHWASFISADTVLCSSKIGAEHFVINGGSRLTNRRGAERLEIFKALTATVSRLQNTPNRVFYIEPFVSFSVKIIDWVRENMDPSLHGQLHRLSRNYFLNNFTQEQITIAAYKNPRIVGRLNRIVAGG